MKEDFLNNTELALIVIALRYLVGVIPPESEKVQVGYQVLHNKMLDLYIHRGGKGSDFDN